MYYTNNPNLDTLIQQARSRGILVHITEKLIHVECPDAGEVVFLRESESQMPLLVEYLIEAIEKEHDPKPDFTREEMQFLQERVSTYRDDAYRLLRDTPVRNPLEEFLTALSSKIMEHWFFPHKLTTGYVHPIPQE